MSSRVKIIVNNLGPVPRSKFFGDLFLRVKEYSNFLLVLEYHWEQVLNSYPFFKLIFSLRIANGGAHRLL